MFSKKSTMAALLLPLLAAPAAAVDDLQSVAKDLERAYILKKPAETDPLEWPYVFLAEGDGDFGACQSSQRL